MTYSIVVFKGSEVTIEELLTESDAPTEDDYYDADCYETFVNCEYARVQVTHSDTEEVIFDDVVTVPNASPVDATADAVQPRRFVREVGWRTQEYESDSPDLILRMLSIGDTEFLSLDTDGMEFIQSWDGRSNEIWGVTD